MKKLNWSLFILPLLLGTQDAFALQFTVQSLLDKADKNFAGFADLMEQKGLKNPLMVTQILKHGNDAQKQTILNFLNGTHAASIPSKMVPGASSKPEQPLSPRAYIPSWRNIGTAGLGFALLGGALGGTYYLGQRSQAGLLNAYKTKLGNVQNELTKTIKEHQAYTESVAGKLETLAEIQRPKGFWEIVLNPSTLINLVGTTLLNLYTHQKDIPVTGITNFGGHLFSSTISAISNKISNPLIKTVTTASTQAGYSNVLLPWMTTWLNKAFNINQQPKTA